MLIDCDTCQAPRSACADCVMTALLQLRPRPVEFEPAEAEALGALADAGLVPPLRLVVGVDPSQVRPGAGSGCQLDPADGNGLPGQGDSGGFAPDRDERSSRSVQRPARGPGFRGIA